MPTGCSGSVQSSRRARCSGSRGIGPFYASLIVVRGTGFTDVLVPDESRSLDLIRQLYGLADLPTPAELEELAEPWRPFRTWCTVLIRAAGHRVLVSS